MNSKTLYVFYSDRSGEGPVALVFRPMPTNESWRDVDHEQEARAVFEMLKARMPGTTWRAFARAIVESVIPIHTYKDKIA